MMLFICICLFILTARFWTNLIAAVLYPVLDLIMLKAIIPRIEKLGQPSVQAKEVSAAAPSTATAILVVIAGFIIYFTL